MIVSHEWLRAFVPHALSAEQVGELLGAHVATLEGVEALRADLAPFVVGQVVASERIPDTKLSANRVDDGSGALLDVVCGAPNVEVGAKYPFARTGTTMPGGTLTIERRKIRGHTSNGMLCSARELGLGDAHDGILALATDAAPGTPLLDVLPVGDARIELDVLANRPDLLSQRGVAREVAALTGIPLQTPPELRAAPALPDVVAGAEAASAAGVTVRIDDPAGCPRYCAAVVRGVRVGPSPEWLVRRLEGLGARSINNVVDATNYALHGLGQPMHAFDLARLADATVVVRRAHPGEPITTLDGMTRTLDDAVLVIADAGRAQAVAGVIGGRDSEVTDETVDVLLEVAYFDPRRTRVSRRQVNVNTDASYRFERGVDRAATRELLDAGVALLTAVAGGTVAAILDVGAAPGPLPPVTLREDRIAQVLGVAVGTHDVERLLSAVGFELRHDADAPDRGRVWRVQPPSWRQDVAREIDLVEEVARLVGFDAFPDELRPARPGTSPDDAFVIATRRVRGVLVAAGLLETRPLPFVRGDDATHTRVANPLGEDEPHLRRSVLETLVGRAEHNLARMQGDVRLFEIGSTFEPTAAGALPTETLRVGALVMGARRPPHFTDPKPPAFDVWDAKWIGERAARAAHPSGRVVCVPSGRDDELWHVTVDERVVGRVVRLALDAPVWAAPAFGVEIALGVIASEPVAGSGANRWSVASDGYAPGAPASVPPVRFRPLPTTPAVELDLALVVPDGVAAAAIADVLRTSGGAILESVDVFDEFRGGDLPPGTRSLAWRLVLRDPSRTLREKEVEARRERLLAGLEAQLGVRARGR